VHGRKGFVGHRRVVLVQLVGLGAAGSRPPPPATSTVTGDFALYAELGLTHHRLSIEWARLEPLQGEYDRAAIEHYREPDQAPRSRANASRPARLTLPCNVMSVELVRTTRATCGWAPEYRVALQVYAATPRPGTGETVELVALAPAVPTCSKIDGVAPSDGPTLIDRVRLGGLGLSYRQARMPPGLDWMGAGAVIPNAVDACAADGHVEGTPPPEDGVPEPDAPELGGAEVVVAAPVATEDLGEDPHPAKSRTAVSAVALDASSRPRDARSNMGVSSVVPPGNGDGTRDPSAA